MKKSKMGYTLLFLSCLIVLSLAKGIVTYAAPSSDEIRDTKWITKYPTSYYNDGKYTGQLSRYLDSGEYIAPKTKNAKVNVSGYSDRTYSCSATHDGVYYWKQEHGDYDNSNLGNTYSYSDGEGYSGTLNRTGTIDKGTSAGNRPACSSSSHEGRSFTRRYNYEAVYSGPVVKPGVDTRIYLYQGWVEAQVSDPSDDYHQPGTSTGSADGRAFWELRRTNQDKSADGFASSAFSITGEHYATRNPMHFFSFAGYSKQQPGPISTTRNIESAKGSNFNYSFSYEFTNYYRDVYTCTDSRAGGCYAWVYSGRVPAWNLGSSYTLAGSISLDHSQGETIVGNTMDDVLVKRWIVGREDKWGSRVRQSKPYYEQLRRGAGNDRKSKYDLKTQSHIPITPGKWVYEVELPSDAHKGTGFQPLKKEGSAGFFYPADVDDSLKEDYKK